MTANLSRRRKIIVFATPGYSRILNNWMNRLPKELAPYVHIYSYGRIYSAILKRTPFQVTRVRSRAASRSQLWFDRVHAVLAAVEMGHEVTLVDADAMLLGDFFGLTSSIQADLIASQGVRHPIEVFENWGFVLCCGFMIFRPTLATKDFLRKVLDSDKHDFDDQRAINSILHQRGLLWEGGIGEYQVNSRGKSIRCFENVISGIVNLESAQAMKVSMLPHALFRRLPNEVEEKVPLVFHPQPGGKGRSVIINSLKSHNLWG